MNPGSQSQTYMETYLFPTGPDLGVSVPCIWTGPTNHEEQKKKITFQELNTTGRQTILVTNKGKDFNQSPLANKYVL